MRSDITKNAGPTVKLYKKLILLEYVDRNKVARTL